MREYPAGRGTVRIDVEGDRVGITAITAYGDGVRVRLLPVDAADVARGIGLAVVEALGAKKAPKTAAEMEWD